MTFQPWQRASILAAVTYLRDQGKKTAGDPVPETLSQALLEVLEPARRTARLQRESAQGAKSAAVAGHERRRRSDRRGGADRRRNDVNWPGVGWAGPERRSGLDRRSGRDRRAGR